MHLEQSLLWYLLSTAHVSRSQLRTQFPPSTAALGQGLTVGPQWGGCKGPCCGGCRVLQPPRRGEELGTADGWRNKTSAGDAARSGWP